MRWAIEGVFWEETDWDSGSWWAITNDKRAVKWRQIIDRYNELCRNKHRTPEQEREYKSVCQKQWGCPNVISEAVEWPFEDGKRYRVTVEEIEGGEEL